MTDFDRQPGAIDDPGMKGGLDPQLDRLPPGNRADDTGGPGEPHARDLDLPGPDDPVAWSYVEADTLVVGRDGSELGRVDQMLGTETEGIFQGVAVRPRGGGKPRVVPADAVTGLTPGAVTIEYDAEQLDAAEEHHPVDD
jgi:hypothetical protein